MSRREPREPRAWEPRAREPRAREPRGRGRPGEPRGRGRPGLFALLLVGLSACPAQQRAPAGPAAPLAQPARAPAHLEEPAQPDRAGPDHVIVAVADLTGDRERLVKERVLAHLRAFAPGPRAPAGAFEIEVIDLPRTVLAPEAGGAASPLDVLQEGHARAREILAETRAGALIWGTAGAPDTTDAPDAPVLYVTTAESSHWPCDSDPARASEDVPAETDHVLCALDTGATWLLCATAWARIVPVGCAP